MKGLHHEDEVKGLELMDEGVGVGELWDLSLSVEPLLVKGATTRQAGVILDHLLMPHGRGLGGERHFPSQRWPETSPRPCRARGQPAWSRARIGLGGPRAAYT